MHNDAMAIKAEPEDFIVEEVLDPEWVDAVNVRPGPHALYAVRKRSLTTHELLDLLAGRLDLPVHDLSAAGLKDKHAVTTQHVTVRVDVHRPLPPKTIQADSYQARLLGYVRQAIDSQAIHRNHFQIIVRGLTRRAIDELHEASQRLTEPTADARLLVANYYGNQRFGSARAGQGFIAAHLVRSEFEQALKLAIGIPHRRDLHRVKILKQAAADHWENRNWKAALQEAPRIPERAALEHLARKPSDFRGAFAALPYFFQQLCVEAYQSLLWNRIATRLLTDRLGESGKLWVVDDKFGQLVFPERDAVPDDLRDLDLPVLGRKTELHEPWREAAGAVLAEEGITVDQLRIAGLDRPWFGEVPRRLFMIAERFTISEPEPDEMQEKARRFRVTTSFTLPRGGYATVVLRALGQ